MQKNHSISSYLLKEDSPLAIYELNPYMKLLLIVREPVERMMSQLIHAMYRYNMTWPNLARMVLDKSTPPKVLTTSKFVDYSDYYK